MSTVDSGFLTTRGTPSLGRTRILVVDTNYIFRERLQHKLTADGHEVLTAESGWRAFSLLRDWNRPVSWLYSRAVLDSLLDGWILADEYHSLYPKRPAFIAASEARSSASGDIVLKDPSPDMILELLRCAVSAAQSIPARCSDMQRHAA